MKLSNDPRIAIWQKEQARVDADEPPPNFQNKPKRHHYVPEFYLERFAALSQKKNPTPRVQRIEASKGLASSALIGVHDAAVETDFYTVETDDPRRVHEAEHIIGVFERAAGYAFRNLDRAPDHLPDDIDRENLSLYMALQFARVHDMRDFQAEVYTKSLSMAMRVAAEHRDVVRNVLVSAGGEEPPEDDVDETVAALREGWRSVAVTPHKNDVVATMLKNVPEFFRYFYLRRWAIARSTIPLLTSDRPVVLYQRPGKRQPWEGVGLMTADMIVFPLDRHRALVMQHPEPGNFEGVRDVSTGYARQLNTLIANGAWRWLFHSM